MNVDVTAVAHPVRTLALVLVLLSRYYAFFRVRAHFESSSLSTTDYQRGAEVVV